MNGFIRRGPARTGLANKRAPASNASSADARALMSADTGIAASGLGKLAQADRLLQSGLAALAAVADALSELPQCPRELKAGKQPSIPCPPSRTVPPPAHREPGFGFLRLRTSRRFLPRQVRLYLCLSRLWRGAHCNARCGVTRGDCGEPGKPPGSIIVHVNGISAMAEVKALRLELGFSGVTVIIRCRTRQQRRLCRRRRLPRRRQGRRGRHAMRSWQRRTTG